MAYQTISGGTEAEISEKKSRFIAHLAHVETEEEALQFLEGIRQANQQARHNVYAYLLQNGRTRYSDDGEPAQTSGLPTFQVLEHAGLSDVICVTTRYFGGTLLGTGGLVRAYTQAAQTALAEAEIVTIDVCVDVAITVDYPLYETVMRTVQSAGAQVMGSDFTDKVQLSIRVLEQDLENTRKRLIEVTHGSVQISATEPFNAPFARHQ